MERPEDNDKPFIVDFVNKMFHPAGIALFQPMKLRKILYLGQLKDWQMSILNGFFDVIGSDAKEFTAGPCVNELR